MILAAQVEDRMGPRAARPPRPASRDWSWMLKSSPLRITTSASGRRGRSARARPAPRLTALQRPGQRLVVHVRPRIADPTRRKRRPIARQATLQAGGACPMDASMDHHLHCLFWHPQFLDLLPRAAPHGAGSSVRCRAFDSPLPLYHCKNSEHKCLPKSGRQIIAFLAQPALEPVDPLRGARSRPAARRAPAGRSARSARARAPERPPPGVDIRRDRYPLQQRVLPPSTFCRDVLNVFNKMFSEAAMQKTVLSFCLLVY